MSAFLLTFEHSTLNYKKFIATLPFLYNRISRLKLDSLHPLNQFNQLVGVQVLKKHTFLEMDY